MRKVANKPRIGSRNMASGKPLANAGYKTPLVDKVMSRAPKKATRRRLT